MDGKCLFGSIDYPFGVNFSIFYAFLLQACVGIRTSNHFPNGSIEVFHTVAVKCLIDVILFRQGGIAGPGVSFILPCVDSFSKVDLRSVSFNIPPQEILSKDSVTISVDAVVYYRINDPLKSVLKIENHSYSTRLLGAAILRNILGTRTLAEILAERDAISATMQAALDEATDPWGVKVERVEIKDVSLPSQLQRAMAAEAEASREARAKVIAAEGNP